MKAVIFDIDGTLTPEISWLFLTEALGASKSEHLEIFNSMKAGEIDLPLATSQLLRLWQASGQANLGKLREIFDKVSLREGALEIVNYLRSENYKLCLISGSMGLYAETIAKKLGVEAYFSNTELIFDKAGQLINFKYQPDQGAIKLKQLMEFCARENITLKDCAVIGDSGNDLEIFKATGHGIILKGGTPEPTLGDAAWKKIEDLGEIKAIL